MQKNNTVKAINKNVRCSPRKISLVLDYIRGKKVDEAIKSLGASSMKDIGMVMGALKSSLAGSADMGLVSKVVKDKLS